MTDVEQIVQRLAIVAAAKKRLIAAENADKQSLLEMNRRRTEYAIDDDGNEMATVIVKYADSDPQPKARIADESVVMPWMMEKFGDETVETITRITEQGRNSAELYAVSQFLGSGEHLPGVEIIPAAEKKLSVSVTPARDITDREVERGAVVLAEILSIGVMTLEPAKPGEPA